MKYLPLKIHKEGRHIIMFVTILIIVINVPVYIWEPRAIFVITLLLSAILLVFVTYFFRSPVRVLEVEDVNHIVSPCDGRVVVIEPVHENDHFHDERLQVSIFMSPFNVHANWYPIAGKILRSEHQNGRHLGAWLPKSSTENERSLVVIEAPSQDQIMVRQVAGAMARRVVTYAKPGLFSHRNEHMGFIKFGSRVDLYLPIGTEVFVDYGDYVKGNETIIACLRPNEDDTSIPQQII
ncbi:MAG: phosphatidylserine decarboxylase family protein [Paludibacteraceae bacterium]|nr:phosphatidylserine decarboxylase family protein [Paludibacteraceae bacterium]